MSNYNWNPNQNQNGNYNAGPNGSYRGYQNGNGNYNVNYNYQRPNGQVPYNNPYQQNRPQKDHGLAHMNWMLPIVMFFIGIWPVGIILAILKVVDMQAEKNEQEGRTRNWYNRVYNGTPNANATGNAGYRYQYQAWNGAAQPGAARPQNVQQPMPGQPMNRAAAPGPQARPVQGTAPQARPAANAAASASAATMHTPVFSGRATAEQQKSARVHTMISVLLIFMAIVALATGIPELLSGLGSLGLGLGYALSVFVPGALKALGGCILAFVAGGRMKARRKEKVLATITGTRNSISLKELSAASGFNAAKTLQLTKEAIQHGLFGPYSYVDMATQTLIVRGIPPKAPTKADAKAAAAKGDAKYQKILADLRDANDRIPGEEMSAKISKLETLSARIFDLAEKDPQKKPQLSRFMDYYLPTALKLLNTYATLDQQGMAGQNISETKANIENAMDMLIKAFEAQLDKLFQTDALDVSSDITALQGMMSMDGLTGTDFAASLGNQELDRKYQASAPAAVPDMPDIGNKAAAKAATPAALQAPGADDTLEAMLKGDSSTPDLHL